MKQTSKHNMNVNAVRLSYRFWLWYFDKYHRFCIVGGVCAFFVILALYIVCVSVTLPFWWFDTFDSGIMGRSTIHFECIRITTFRYCFIFLIFISRLLLLFIHGSRFAHLSSYLWVSKLCVCILFLFSFFFHLFFLCHLLCTDWTCFPSKSKFQQISRPSQIISRYP